jgi:FAD synthase
MDAQLEGTITKYRGNGRKLGYPTANIATDTELADGVYFGYAQLGQYADHPAVIFIGTPTTKGLDDTARRVEAHLLNVPDQDYYGQYLVLQIKHFHRPNQQFATVDDLLKAISADDTSAREWFVQQ